jgi:predicted PurR-regulated permease PerM
MWIKGRFFKYSIGTILVLLIILLLYDTSPVFSPILWFIAAAILPVLFATLLYYILRPLVNLMDNWMPRYIAILTIYFVFLVIIVGLILRFTPDAIEAINSISPEKITSLK